MTSPLLLPKALDRPRQEYATHIHTMHFGESWKPMWWRDTLDEIEVDAACPDTVNFPTAKRIMIALTPKKGELARTQ